MAHVVGLDVSQKTTAICVVDTNGTRLWRGVCASNPDQIEAAVRRHAGDDAKVGVETGAMTPWLVHELRERGLHVICLDARHARAALKMQSHPGLLELVLEAFGVAIFGQGAAYQTCVVFLGAGANGKGQVIYLLEQMIPSPMRSAVSPRDWSNDWHRYGMEGKVANTVGELPQLKDEPFQWFKKIVGGDTVSVRPVRGNTYDAVIHAQHIFSTNKLPVMPETNEATYRRFRIIPFRNTVPLEKRIPHFAEELFNDQKEALLLLAVEGMERVLRRRYLQMPEISRFELNKWLKPDVVANFFGDMLQSTGNPSHRVSSSEMFDACVQYAAREGLSPPASQKELAYRLRSRRLKSIKSTGKMYWYGVQVRSARELGEDKSTSPPRT